MGVTPGEGGSLSTGSQSCSSISMIGGVLLVGDNIKLRETLYLKIVSAYQAIIIYEIIAKLWVFFHN